MAVEITQLAELVTIPHFHANADANSTPEILPRRIIIHASENLQEKLMGIFLDKKKIFIVDFFSKGWGRVVFISTTAVSKFFIQNSSLEKKKESIYVISPFLSVDFAEATLC